MPSRRISMTVLAIAAMALAMGSAGCRKRSAQAAPPLVIVPSESQPAAPTTPATTTTNPAGTKPAETPPASAPGLVVPPAKKSSPRSTAPRTTPAEPPTTPPAETTPKPTPPRMSPRLSPGELAEYEKKTNAAINVAEKNLQTAYGKQLNAEQNDVLEKIRGFLGQAREAMRAGDWQRAYNLAEKARVLSVELVNSP